MPVFVRNAKDQGLTNVHPAMHPNYSKMETVLQAALMVGLRARIMSARDVIQRVQPAVVKLSSVQLVKKTTSWT